MHQKGVVSVNFTIGFGNNLFQYCYARLLAENNDMGLHHKGIPEFNIPPAAPPVDSKLRTYIITDDTALQGLEHRLTNNNVVVNGYFEDYRLYEKDLERIRSWFPRVPQANTTDLILHLRLQNRLVQQTHHKNHILAEGYKRGMEKFKFDRLHIITDAKKWEPHTEEDIEEIRDEITVGPNPAHSSPWVKMDQSLYYINTLIEGFADMNPIVHIPDAPVIKGTGGLRSNHMQDFDFIRSFDQIMIFNSTFSWWAALLSDAKHVGTWLPWKPNKGPRNKNLGQTAYPGWFSWGSTEDLYWEKK